MRDECELHPIFLPPLPANPLVSVLVTSYNYARFLPEALDSILAQTYTNWETIICDDGSTDNSRQVIESYLARDSRFRCVFKQNGGLSTALNAAYSESNGDIIAMLDADDVMMPLKCSHVVEMFRADKEVGLVGHPLIPISATGERIGDPIPARMDDGWLGPRALISGGRCNFTCYYGGGSSFRRQIAECVFPIPPELRGADAYVMGLAQFITKFCASPDADGSYRLHGANMTGLGDGSLPHLRQAIVDIVEVYDYQVRFLRERYGKQIAERLRLEDNHNFRSRFMLYHALTREVPTELGPVSVTEVLSKFPNLTRTFWSLMMIVPRTASAALYRLWWERIRSSQLSHSVRSLFSVPAS